MPRIASPFARQARKRTALAKARAIAPKHPVGPEQQLRAAVSRVVRAYHKRLRELIAAHARQGIRLDDAVTDDTPRARGLLMSVFAAAASYAHSLLYQSPFRRLLAEAAKRTADSAKKQTATALDLGDDFDPNLSDQTDDLASRVFNKTSTLLNDSNDRAADIFAEWDDLDPETSPRAEDVDALDGMLDDGLDGILGSALASAGLAFGDAFADMIQGSQVDAGVSSYTWLSQRDSHVRPAHAALDGVIAKWSDPPLTALDSDSGEDCHPGEDYNCRCVASPIDDDDGLTDRQTERLPN